MRMTLKAAEESDLRKIQEMESDAEISEFIIPYSLDEHCRHYASKNIVYLLIYSEDRLKGYFILHREDDSDSIEFRRLVINDRGRGYGQAAICSLHAYCREVFNASRVWLDVFEHNARGRHVYEKLGYKRFGSQEHRQGRLLLYEIHL